MAKYYLKPALTSGGIPSNLSSLADSQLYDPEGQRFRELWALQSRFQRGMLCASAVSPGGAWLASSSIDSNIIFADFNTGQLTGVFNLESRFHVTSMAWGSESLLFAGCSNGVLLAINYGPTHKRPIAILPLLKPFASPISVLALDLVHNRLALGCGGDTFVLSRPLFGSMEDWELIDHIPAPAEGHQALVTALLFISPYTEQSQLFIGYAKTGFCTWRSPHSYHSTPYGAAGGACSIGSASASPDGTFISIITLDHSIVIYPVAHDGPMVNEGRAYHGQQLSGSRPIVPVALMGNNLILRGTISGEVSILDLSSGPLAPLQTGSGDMVRTLVRYGDKIVVGLSDPTGHTSQTKCYFDTTAPPPREWARIDNDHRVFEVSITDLEATGAIFSAGSKRFLTFDKSEATIATITEEEEAVEATLKEKELDGGLNVDHPMSFDVTWVGTRARELQHKLVAYILALAQSRRVWWTLGWIWAFTVVLVVDPPQLSEADRTPHTNDVGFAKGTPSGFAAQYALQKHVAQMETPGLMFLLYFLGAHMVSRFAWWASWGLELVMLLLGLVLRVLVFAIMLFPGVVRYTQQHLPRFLSRVVCEVMLEFGDFPICAGVV